MTQLLLKKIQLLTHYSEIKEQLSTTVVEFQKAIKLSYTMQRVLPNVHTYNTSDIFSLNRKIDILNQEKNSLENDLDSLNKLLTSRFNHC